MKKKSIRLWRGLLALFLSLSIALMGLTSVADQWRPIIDQAFGTTSTETINDARFISDYETTDELIEAHEELGERMGAEGVVLLKNENQALPLNNENPKVTLLGMGSAYPFLGGTMGSTVTNEEQKNLAQSLEEKGYEVNPTMLDIYTALGSIQTGEFERFGNTIPVFGYRPSNFSIPYEPSEPALNVYTDSTDGAGASEDYVDSFNEYNDAAIVVFSRPGSEGSDFYPGKKGIDSEEYGTDTPLGLANNERAVLELAKSNFDTVIVMINSSSTMEIEELKQDDEVDAILYVGFPGAYGFLGIADVLKGEVSPSGRLTDTYAVHTANSPAMQNFGKVELDDLSPINYPGSLMGDLPATSPLGSFGGDASMAADHYIIQAEGIYTGYKYYETRYYDSIIGAGNADSSVGAGNGASSWMYENEVTYPFGYGLSYTTFSQSLDSLEVDMDERTITATATIENTGETSGKHVAQLYVQTPYTDYNREQNIEKSAVDLLGFEKTNTLNPGEQETVTITVDAKYMASWDSSAKDGEGGYILDGGDYFFTLAENAHAAVNNILVEQGFSVDGDDMLVSVVEIGEEGFVDETTFAYSDNGTPVVNQLEDADINYYKPGYATYLTRNDWEGTFPRTYDDLAIDGDKVDEWVQNLANENYHFIQNGDANVDGIQHELNFTDMAGVDDIDDIRWDHLVNQIPLDILIPRIAKGGSTSDVIEEINSPLIYQNDGPNGFGGTLSGRGLNEDDENADYALGTMANATLIASTFNKDLAHEWGELMGNDGLWSGNYLIWGVASNIHRTPYNGRNHEYYSEDPMVSNYMSIATVQGALNYGVIVGPKHFAFNDQETQRSGIAPYMTEQKAREGDLRAFQGPFEDGGALGGMVTFSRIGATNGNNSVPLLINILREEWGFNGLLSTDMVNNMGYFRPESIINAGVTMMADFGSNETMEQVRDSWPYFTVDRVSQDETFVERARENMKYQLYAYAQSAAQNVQTTRVTPWWESAMNIGIYGGMALAILSFALYLLAILKAKKEEA
ncbi:beta-glucosidase [Natronobacillus azotifigens]|uniref:Glycoside hydrolase family 3 C-terminal domain-containing protein n=1 Tax=Natronobacillus azotifigens TaxID=472978 RepID=A0A9J6RC00_9BACI|nr:glycoside hydrolase family 3 C-terminal domain-containing protein [Natronobacillus azotifigens]MCZ0703218.1 glycoside hydrolase family 3 C-terminal domain-containing protein [Natronobacillus azotifigens]